MKDIWKYLEDKNIATYGKYCGHRDRCVVPDEEGHIILCRTCGSKAKWNGKDYQQKLPRKLVPKRGRE
jgi:hypothetical protein